MKELLLMPEELTRTRACGQVVTHYAQSFQVFHSWDFSSEGIQIIDAFYYQTNIYMWSKLKLAHLEEKGITMCRIWKP